MRNPSIHITKSDFKKAFKELGLKISEKDIDELFIKCNRYRVRGRHLIFSDNKSLIEKLIINHKREQSNFELFNSLLTMIRKDLGHKFVRFIDKDEAQFLVLKEITTIAEEYCELFNLSEGQGFSEFIRTGLKLIGKNYAVNKFKYYKDKIFKSKEIELLIGSDSDKHLTDEIIEYYTKKCLESGFSYTLDTIEEYADFIHCKNEIVSNGCSLKDWINAQFEGIALMDSIPNSNQLHGLNSNKRFKTYIMNNKVVKPEKFDYLNYL